LLRAGYEEALVLDVIHDFARKGYQSDRRFAEVLSGHRLRQGYGPLRVQAELRQKGIAERALCVPVEPGDFDQALEKAYRRRYGDAIPESLEDRAARERYLLRRGFSGQQIRLFFRELIAKKTEAPAD
jgi:regulatory protein